MITREKGVLILAASAFTIVAAMPVQALTMQECSAKYKAAQTAGTLGAQKWNDFRKEQCGSDTAATPATTTTAATPKATRHTKGRRSKTGRGAKVRRRFDPRKPRGIPRRRRPEIFKRARPPGA